MRASLKGHTEIVQLLLAHADIDIEIEDKVMRYRYEVLCFIDFHPCIK